MANRILMQFHITGNCNLRCKHCYRCEGDVERLSFNDVISVFEQFKELREKYNSYYNIRAKGHVNITGGEPFFRKDIKDILNYIGNNQQYFSYGILSNGSFIDDGIIALLKKTKVSFVQLSIDGDKNTHDELRAKGDYDRVFRIAKKLVKNKIRTYISFTANSQNIRYLPKVALKCRKTGITKLWTDKLVPIGNGENLDSIDETSLPKYLKAIDKARFFTKLSKTEMSSNRALQFMSKKGNIYSCSAGDSLITVDEMGNIMPCRRMPIICANIFDSTLSEVYFKNEVFKELRSKFIPKECAGCTYSLWCRGGAKCQSYAKYGSFYRADPACPLKTQ